MYKTFSAIILNRFEALNLRLLSQIANVKRRPTQAPIAKEEMEVDREREGTPAPSAVAVAGTTGTPAGGKKKKKGKRWGGR
jgi:signal recognition particle subunit SRP9